MCLGIALQGKAAVMHAFSHAYGGHHIVQRLARAHMHQHTARRHQTDAGAAGDGLQLLQTQRVVEALQQLDGEPAMGAIFR